MRCTLDDAHSVSRNSIKAADVEEVHVIALLTRSVEIDDFLRHGTVYQALLEKISLCYKPVLVRQDQFEDEPLGLRRDQILSPLLDHPFNRFWSGLIIAAVDEIKRF